MCAFASMAASPPPLASDQIKRLAELQRRFGRLPDDMLVNNDEEAAFRRFLVARKWDVDKAEEQLRKSLEWRRSTFGVSAFLVRSRSLRWPLLMPSARRRARRWSGLRLCASCCLHTRFWATRERGSLSA